MRTPSVRKKWDKGTRRGSKVMKKIERAEDDSPELDFCCVSDDFDLDFYSHLHPQSRTTA